jgi:hypothetical protein
MGKKKADGRRPGSGKQHVRPYSPSQRNIVDVFRKHLEAGNSPRSFIGLLKGSDLAYSMLKGTNKAFYELAEEYTPAMFRRGQNHYNPENINEGKAFSQKSNMWKPEWKEWQQELCVPPKDEDVK